MNYFYSLAFILFVSLPAFLFLKLMDSKKELGTIESLALSYGIGLGIVSIEMAIFALYKISFTRFNIALPLIILATFLGLLFWNRGIKLNLNLKVQVFNKIELFFLGCITFEVLYAFFKTLIKPMESYDAVAVWALKSKAFFIHHGIPLELFTNPDYRFFNATHPLLLSFSETYIYTLLGHFNDFASKMIFPMFFLSCLLLLYFALKRIGLSRKYALIFTFMLASVPHFNAYATNGYADLIVGYYYSIGILFLYFWFEKKNLVFLIVSAIMTALAGCTKSEGLLLALINIIIFLIFMAKEIKRQNLISKFLFYLIIIIAIIIPGIILVYTVAPSFSHHSLNIYSLKEFKFENFKRIGLILYKYQKQFFGIKHWNLVWILFFISLFLGFKRFFFGNVKFLTLAVVFIFLAYTLVYIISQRSGTYGSADRLFLDFLPVVVFLSAVGLGVRDV